MPKTKQTAVRRQQTITPISKPQIQGEFASPVDLYVEPEKDANIEGLIKGLGELNPKLNNFFYQSARKDRREGKKEGKADFLAGKPLDPNASAFKIEAYQTQKGIVEGTAYGEELYTKWKGSDAGEDPSGWLDDDISAEIKGNENKSYVQGFAQYAHVTKAKIQGEYNQYVREQISTKVISTATQRLQESFEFNGRRFTVESIEQGRVAAGAMGISNSDYNTMLFTVANNSGLNGNFKAYDSLKENRSDGTPGMYHIPSWKDKIDRAIIASEKIFVNATKGEMAAEHAQEKLEVDAAIEDISQLPFEERGPAVAAYLDSDFKFMSNRNHVTALLTKPSMDDPGDPEAEREITKDILTGNGGGWDANKIFDKGTGMSVEEATRVHNTFVAAGKRDAEGKTDAVYGIYKQDEFKHLEKQLGKELKPKLGVLEKLTDLQQTNIGIANSMVDDFFKYAKGKKPEELRSLFAEIRQRGKELQREAKEDNETGEKDFDHSSIKYRSAAQMLKSQVALEKRGYPVLSTFEIENHRKYFKWLKSKKPQQKDKNIK
jgi:hypothetical protein